MSKPGPGRRAIDGARDVERIGVCMPRQEREMLTSLAAAAGCGVSAMLRRLVREEYARTSGATGPPN